jgi:hypothetical protein
MTKTPTTSSLTATPFASSSPTTGSGGGTSNTGAIALIVAAFGVMVGGIVAGAKKIYAYVAAKVAALKRKL